ncbi:ead/Ea22-like family protein [Pseudomonas azerbaijanoccidens]|uniref:ead/Ea22-like family protein n=1 Tax=Pseudomonas azerbaijanoccidentalis TaxID=2842347 RepID=UPI00200B4056|nr:ead/Ea22-like family protein [Pseudomonas azerbaijanoccidentalis]MCK8667232.1 ead/Ea22-like family protein [Pseudomonas azerbaijanoccidentalis]
MTDHSNLKDLAEVATQGGWQVIETELPCRLGRPHVERRIFTTKDHPQLKAPWPVVNGSVALGTDESPVHHMVSMTAEDAAFIAAANPAAVLALIADNEHARMRIKELDLLFGRYLLGMRASVIEWQHGEGADAAMQWIWNGLAGPGELPPEDEIEAQAYFDREISAVEAGMEEVAVFFDVRRAAKQVAP